jgi:hypothetical protein
MITAAQKQAERTPTLTRERINATPPSPITNEHSQLTHNNNARSL